MATQAEIIKIVETTGFYTAKLHKWKPTYPGARCAHGFREVEPAQRLAEKGVLRLQSETKENFTNGGEIIHYTWVKA